MQDFNTQIFSDGFRDKIFDMEFITVLGHALDDKNSNMRNSAVDIFIAAIAQGTLSLFFMILILKYLQMAFRTRYLTENLLLHLDRH